MLSFSFRLLVFNQFMCNFGQTELRRMRSGLELCLSVWSAWWYFWYRKTIFDLFWPHWESLLIRWLGDYSCCPSPTGFAVMAYRSRNRLMSSLLVMGLTFLVTGCWIHLVNQEAAHLIGWPSSHGTSPDPYCILSPKKKGRSMECIWRNAGLDGQPRGSSLFLSGIISILQVSYMRENLKESESIISMTFFASKRRDDLTAKDYFWPRSEGNGRPNHRKYAKNRHDLFLPKYGAIFLGIMIFIAS